MPVAVCEALNTKAVAREAACWNSLPKSSTLHAENAAGSCTFAAPAVPNFPTVCAACLAELAVLSLLAFFFSSPHSVHILTDGRDVPDGSSIKFTEELEEVLKELEVGCRCGGVMGVVQKEVAALPGGAA